MFVGHAPDYIASLLTPASDIPSRSLLRSSNCDLVVPRTSRKTGDGAFSVAATRAWNRLPTDLKLLRSTASFKSKLKSFLFHVLTPGTLCELWNAPSVWLEGGTLQVTVVTVTVVPKLISFSIKHIIMSQVCDEPLHSIRAHDQGILLATGSHSGATTLLELSSALNSLQRNEKSVITAVTIYQL